MPRAPIPASRDLRQPRGRRRYAVVLAACVLPACNDVTVHSAPSGNQLCQEFFEACVAPLLLNPINVPGRNVTITCAAEGCHDIDSGSGGAFKLYPNAANGSDEMAANFLSARGFSNVSDPPLSRILLEPLAGTDPIVGTHGGGDIFADPNDTRYQEMYYWISHPQSIATEACPALDHFPGDPAKRCLDDGTP